MPNIEGTAWVRRLHPSPADRRLICFPHVGGAATYFAPLARQLSGSVDVLALQYPGRQERLAEPCIDSIDGLVEAIVPELEEWLDRPFALFGHSMGAVVAYEVVRALEEGAGGAGAGKLLGLFVSGRRAPSTWRDERVHEAGDEALLAQVTRLAGTPAVLMEDEEVRQMMLPALRGDYRAIDTYEWRPGPPLRCPVWALVGDEDPLTTEQEAEAWRTHTSGPFELRTFPGAHFYLADHLPTIATLITQKLENTPADDTP